MEYPLIIDGAERGRLRVERQGLYTLYEAELAGERDGLIRLWLHGGGESAYLGLMQPWSGGMYLMRKLSSLEQRGFPRMIDYASNEDASLHNKTEPGESPEPPQEESAPSCPYPAPIAENGDELLWFRRADGSLVSFDGLSSLVALPVSLRKASPGAALREIEGRQYMIFRY